MAEFGGEADLCLAPAEVAFPRLNRPIPYNNNPITNCPACQGFTRLIELFEFHQPCAGRFINSLCTTGERERSGR